MTRGAKFPGPTRWCRKRGMGKLLRHRQTKGPVSARLHLNCRATPRLHPVDDCLPNGGSDNFRFSRRSGHNSCPSAAGGQLSCCWILRVRSGPRAAPPTSQKPFRGRHARTEKVWKRSGGDALSVIVCYMKQKLTGSKSIVIATAIPGVEKRDTPEGVV